MIERVRDDGVIIGLNQAKSNMSERMDEAISILTLFQAMIGDGANLQTVFGRESNEYNGRMQDGLYGMLENVTCGFADVMQEIEDDITRINNSLPDKGEFVPVLVPEEHKCKVFTIIDHVKKGGNVTCHYPIR